MRPSHRHACATRSPAPATRRKPCRRRCTSTSRSAPGGARERKRLDGHARHPRSPLPRGRECAEGRGRRGARRRTLRSRRDCSRARPSSPRPSRSTNGSGFYVAHDHEADVAFDHVAGISNATRTLAALTLRRPARRALDLGTGCGSQALLTSRHAEHVVATDVTERRSRVARLNLELNDVTNVELREGSLLSRSQGERFDLIVSNPPFVVSPDTDLVFRTPASRATRSRASSCGARRSISSRAASRRCSICWGHGAGDDWRERVRGWLAGAAATRGSSAT